MQGDLVEFGGQGRTGPIPPFRDQDNYLGRTFCDVFRQSNAEGVVFLDAAVKLDGSHIVVLPAASYPL